MLTIQGILFESIVERPESGLKCIVSLTITPFDVNIDAHFNPAERLSLGHRHLHVSSGL